MLVLGLSISSCLQARPSPSLWLSSQSGSDMPTRGTAVIMKRTKEGTERGFVGLEAGEILQALLKKKPTR